MEDLVSVSLPATLLSCICRCVHLLTKLHTPTSPPPTHLLENEMFLKTNPSQISPSPLLAFLSEDDVTCFEEQKDEKPSQAPESLISCLISQSPDWNKAVHAEQESHKHSRKNGPTLAHVTHLSCNAFSKIFGRFGFTHFHKGGQAWGVTSMDELCLFVSTEIQKFKWDKKKCREKLFSILLKVLNSVDVQNPQLVTRRQWNEKSLHIHIYFFWTRFFFLKQLKFFTFLPCTKGEKNAKCEQQNYRTNIFRGRVSGRTKTKVQRPQRLCIPRE